MKKIAEMLLLLIFLLLLLISAIIFFLPQIIFGHLFLQFLLLLQFKYNFTYLEDLGP